MTLRYFHAAGWRARKPGARPARPRGFTHESVEAYLRGNAAAAAEAAS